MQRLSILARLLVAIVMMLGMVVFASNAVMAQDDGTPAADGTPVAEEPADEGEDEAAVSALPETGNGPQSDDGQSYLLIAGVAVLALAAAATVVRRARLN